MVDNTYLFLLLLFNTVLEVLANTVAWENKDVNTEKEEIKLYFLQTVHVEVFKSSYTLLEIICLTRC